MGQHYAPEEVSGAVLATELASDLVRLGHQVTFLTCAPSYPTGRVFPGHRNRLFHVQDLDGVRIARVWSYISPHKTFWRRILNYGTFSASTLHGGLLAGKPDVVWSASPPLPLGVSAWLLSRIWGVPWVLRVEDLYPEAAVAAGLLHNRAAIALLAGLERFLYRRATHISLISEGFRTNLLGKGVAAEKLSVIPVWADPNLVFPQPKNNRFRREHRLDDRFVVMYSGNLGYNSALEDAVEAADLLRDESDICFVIVGEGVKKHGLVSLARSKGLHNILFLPYQPRETFATMLAAADVGLVTLSPNSAHTSLPSKTFNIMASGRPILAVAPDTSEIVTLVAEARCGVEVLPGHPDLLARSVLELKGDPGRADELGQNGRSHLERNYSRERCIASHDQTFRRVTAQQAMA
jgi:colanic acid biosynthesis glycosyl transferase WcaI